MEGRKRIILRGESADFFFLVYVGWFSLQVDMTRLSSVSIYYIVHTITTNDDTALPGVASGGERPSPSSNNLMRTSEEIQHGSASSPLDGKEISPCPSLVIRD
jgi:hypothetical protein